MSAIGIAKQSLRFYWKTHLATGVTLIIACAVLTGALTVGDSIKATLNRRTEMRLGKVRTVISCPGLFRVDLASEMENKLALQRSRTAQANEMAVTAAPILQVRGFAENAETSARATDIRIIGVDQRFWRMAPRSSGDITAELNNSVAISRPLARRLNLKSGDDIVVRMRKAGGMPAEALLTQEEQTRVSFRRPVGRIVEDEQFGAFDVYSRPDGGLNVYLPIGQLNALFEIQEPLRANMLLFAGPAGLSEIGQTLKEVWQMDDAGLSLRLVDWPRMLELYSRDVFIPDTIASVILKNVAGGRGVLTYFVNEFRRGNKTVPYSFICALEGNVEEGSFTSLAQNEMIINEWLADQLQASEGDKIEIRYFVPSQGKRLSEQKETLTVKSVVPMMGTGADASLMPAIESMQQAENCRDWKAGIPIDLSKIRPDDERYWDKYKGAPKAFVSMNTGKLLWSNRFGTLTAIRFSVSDYDQKVLQTKILSAIEPWQAGLMIQDVQQAGRKSVQATTDFGSLTIGLSMFLIISSLILTGLVWSFGLRRRAGQMGILLATGLTRGQVIWLFLLEEAIVILTSAVLGAAGGILYTHFLIRGLNSIWAGAAGGLEIFFAWKWLTLVLSAIMSAFAAVIVWFLRIRGLWKRPAIELLDRSEEIFIPAGKSRLSLIASVLSGLAAIVMGFYATRVSAQEATGLFFGCGAMVLISASLFLSAGLSFLGARSKRVSRSLFALAVKNAARRKGRSLAVAITLAMGIFVVLATGVFQQTSQQDPTIKDSGTGGFTLWAQSSIPLVHDLNDTRFQRDIGILSNDMSSFKVMPVRVLPAEDASCLNIAQVARPNLWGVRAEALNGRFRFKKILEKEHLSNPWESLNQSLAEDVVPAIGDWATVYWGLHKDIGDEMDYTDQSGRVFRLKIMALLDDSIWQGGLLISEKQFLRHFESTSGWNLFLMEVPPQSMKLFSEKLTRLLAIYGLEVQPTADRLSQFHQVQNTYIHIFIVLGAMGLVLGTLGAGMVVLLNVLERSGELAMMRATGFEKRKLRIMLFLEHVGLLTAGLFLGIISAAVAAGPQLGQPENLPWKMIAGLLAVMWISGIVWVYIAAAAAMRGDLLEPLRKE